jgi:hypothetical protein
MPVHRRARALGIMRSDGGNDGGVVADRALGKILRVEVLLNPRPQFGTLVPEAFDDKLERAVARRLRKAQVEVAVLRFARDEIVGARLEAFDALAQRVGVFRGRNGRGERGDLPFDELARRQ